MVEATERSSLTPSSSSQIPNQKILSKDDFLELFIAELTHQNPAEPMNNKDFILQMAQLSSLEQLNNLNINITSMFQAQMLSQISQLIGCKVEFIDPSTGELTQGEIKEVIWDGTNSYLQIEDKIIPLSLITKIISKGG